jgi:hypothetical protein
MEKKIDTQILNKHLATVHNCSPLSAVQRKMMNLLIKNAEKTIEEDVEHILPIQEIMKGIGWSAVSNTTEHLKECLKDLVSIKIEWNVLEQDKKARWDTSTLLASAAIKAGNVYYSFSISLRKLLAYPNIYARLDLDVQKMLKNKHSVLFWEYIIGELSSKKQTSIVTDWISYEKILKLTCLEDSVYKKRYTQFLDLVLRKSIDEINRYSDTEIEFETKSQKNKITHIRFYAKKKSAKESLLSLIKDEQEDPVVLKLSSIGLSEKTIRSVVQKYNVDEINSALNFFNKSLDENKEKIKNPVALFKKTLEEGWILPEEINKRNMISVDVKNFSFDDNDIFKDIRMEMSKIIGTELYKSWWQSVDFEEGEDVLTVWSKSLFHKDWIQNKYEKELIDVLSFLRPNIKKIKYDVCDVLKKAS